MDRPGVPDGPQVRNDLGKIQLTVPRYEMVMDAGAAVGKVNVPKPVTDGAEQLLQ